MTNTEPTPHNHPVLAELAALPPLQRAVEAARALLPPYVPPDKRPIDPDNLANVGSMIMGNIPGMTGDAIPDAPEHMETEVIIGDPVLTNHSTRHASFTLVTGGMTVERGYKPSRGLVERMGDIALPGMQYPEMMARLSRVAGQRVSGTILTSNLDDWGPYQYYQDYNVTFDHDVLQTDIDVIAHGNATDGDTRLTVHISVPKPGGKPGEATHYVLQHRTTTDPLFQEDPVLYRRLEQDWTPNPNSSDPLERMGFRKVAEVTAEAMRDNPAAAEDVMEGMKIDHFHSTHTEVTNHTEATAVYQTVYGIAETVLRTRLDFKAHNDAQHHGRS